ncbi:putative ribonuclease H-like domain-containing protein [Tanacetum coccineum]
MDVKSAFIYGKIEEEVHVCQLPGFKNPDFPNRVYKVEKTLYGLRQDPKAWYETLSTYLLDNRFQRGKIDKTLFIRRNKGDILLVQVYVDDIIFGSTKNNQKEDGIFISQDKYVTEILNKFCFTNVKTTRTPMETQKPLLKDEDVCACARYQVNPKVSHLYAMKRIFSDYAGASLDMKSTTKAEYVAASSCCGQAIVKVKMVNGEQQLQALVDGKKIVVTEASVRRDLQLDDAEGTDCLPNATIFEELTIMGYEKLSQKLTFYKAFFSPQWKFLIHTILQCLSAKTSAWNKFSSIMAYAIICLATNQKFNFSKYIFESMVKNLDNTAQEEMGEGSAMPTDPHHTPIFTQPSQPQRKQKSRRPKEKDTQAPRSSVPSDPTNVADEAVNEEPSMQLKELIDFCTKLQQRVLDLENTKTTQAQEITSLKKRVKKLEKKGGSKTYKLKRLYKVGRSARVVSSKEASLGDHEDASKQGRKINDIDKDSEITLVDETQGRYGDEDMVRVNDLDGDEVVVEISAATITNVELTLAQTLVELKSARPKTKGVVMQEPSESTPIISLQLPLQVKGQGSKDKGKAKMIEPEKPLKKKDQIKFDEEEALRLQAKFDEEDRLAREKAQQVEEANIAWDDIQVKIDADYQLAERLQAQEQQELTTEEKSTLFNMAGWKPKDLKNKSFANIQELFDKAFKRVNTFIDFKIKLVEGTEMEESSKKAELMEESSSKRLGDKLEQENAKWHKVDDD